MANGRQVNIRLSVQDLDLIRTAADLSYTTPAMFVAQSARLQATDVVLSKLPEMGKAARDTIRRLAQPGDVAEFRSYYQNQLEKITQFITDLDTHANASSSESHTPTT